jgi:hypothetical protein
VLPGSCTGRQEGGAAEHVYEFCCRWSKGSCPCLLLNPQVQCAVRLALSHAALLSCVGCLQIGQVPCRSAGVFGEGQGHWGRWRFKHSPAAGTAQEWPYLAYGSVKQVVKGVCAVLFFSGLVPGRRAGNVQPVRQSSLFVCCCSQVCVHVVV